MWFCDLKIKIMLVIYLVIFIVFISILNYHQKKVEQLTYIVQNQKAVIEHMQHGHEQTMLSLYSHLTFCEY